MDVITMKQSKNILTEKELEFVNLLMADCENTGDVQGKLKRLFAGAIEQMLEAGSVA
jgi:putative transposase